MFTNFMKIMNGDIDMIKVIMISLMINIVCVKSAGKCVVCVNRCHTKQHSIMSYIDYQDKHQS